MLLRILRRRSLSCHLGRTAWLLLPALFWGPSAPSSSRSWPNSPHWCTGNDPHLWLWRRFELSSPDSFPSLFSNVPAANETSTLFLEYPREPFPLARWAAGKPESSLKAAMWLPPANRNYHKAGLFAWNHCSWEIHWIQSQSTWPSSWTRFRSTHKALCSWGTSRGLFHQYFLFHLYRS